MVVLVASMRMPFLGLFLYLVVNAVLGCSARSNQLDVQQDSHSRSSAEYAGLTQNDINPTDLEENGDHATGHHELSSVEGIDEHGSSRFVCPSRAGGRKGPLLMGMAALAVAGTVCAGNANHLLPAGLMVPLTSSDNAYKMNTPIVDVPRSNVQAKYLDGDFYAEGDVNVDQHIGQENDYGKGNDIGQQNKSPQPFLGKDWPFSTSGDVNAEQTIGQQNNIAAGANVGSIEYHVGGHKKSKTPPGGVQPAAPAPSQPGQPGAAQAPSAPQHKVVGQQNNFGPNTHVGTFQMPMPKGQQVQNGQAQATKAGVPYVAQENNFQGGHYDKIVGTPQGGTTVVKTPNNNPVGGAVQNPPNPAAAGLQQANLGAVQGKYLDGNYHARGNVNAGNHYGTYTDAHREYHHPHYSSGQQNNVGRGGYVGKIVYNKGRGNDDD